MSAVVSAKHTSSFVMTVTGIVRELTVSRLRVLNSVCSHKPKTRVVLSGVHRCRD